MQVYGRSKYRGIPWPTVLALLLLTALIAGGAAFFWQASSLNKAYDENKALYDELVDIKRERDTLKNDNSALVKEISALKDKLPVDEGKSNREILLDKSDEALHMLRDRDMSRLSRLVHPEKGVRFSPYSYIDPTSDVKVTAEGFAKLMTETGNRKWGAYDGTGEPIDLPFSEYNKKFIYDADFLEAPQIVYNQPVQRGNSLMNLKEVYPDAMSVEYHFPGIDPQYNGMDWRSLLLVWEQKDGNWFLTGIIHSQWTI